MSNRFLRYSLYILIALTAFGAGVWVSDTRQGGVPQITAADTVLAISLPDLERKSQTISQWRGKVLVINFWATWCAPCREEIPVFVKMQERYRDNGLQFVGISIDDADKTSEFARNFGINYPTLIGTIDTIETSRQAGNKRRALPFTVIVNRKGQVVATELGGLTHEKLEALINPLL